MIVTQCGKGTAAINIRLALHNSGQEGREEAERGEECERERVLERKKACCLFIF